MIGVVIVCGFEKIFRNVWNFGSSWSSGDFSAAFVVGTLRIPFASFASALVSVVRYLSSTHASSGCFDVFGMPTMLPVV